MVSVLSLLIPIALSAVFVFIASSIIHMATPWHKNDLMKLPERRRRDERAAARSTCRRATTASRSPIR